MIDMTHNADDRSSFLQKCRIFLFFLKKFFNVVDLNFMLDQNIHIKTDAFCCFKIQCVINSQNLSSQEHFLDQCSWLHFQLSSKIFNRNCFRKCNDFDFFFLIFFCLFLLTLCSFLIFQTIKLIAMLFIIMSLLAALSFSFGVCSRLILGSFSTTRFLAAFIRARSFILTSVLWSLPIFVFIFRRTADLNIFHRNSTLYDLFP